MTYVMSDIHGNLKAFNDILKQIDFKPSDELYILGDVIDRNDGGIDILKWVMETENTHMLMGNHELMMLQTYGRYPTNYSLRSARKCWYQNGGDITDKKFKELEYSDRNAILEYLESLPTSFNLTVNDQEFVLVHAAWPELPTKLGFLEENPIDFAVWDRDSMFIIPQFPQFKHITFIFGHTPTCNFQNVVPLQIYNMENIFGIDCGAAYSDIGRLACIRLDDMQVFYSK